MLLKDDKISTLSDNQMEDLIVKLINNRYYNLVKHIIIKLLLYIMKRFKI